ncbi:lysophospholipid acyltransferase family protein [Halothermothrix orenii]|uniref:1-acyl-sn-glycerol-3-phosphate acyltransferase n=1 Tax=Halothermothrix orenii (strain H 168 / OCM 544 / DSM 9562) TaxID=373903 RepID=B8CWX7_HALOH|nr:lysophospholipid acyltransferase family protein [Halothermothrix orenii]ACL69796.1 1-acylglycerol-3-phosphate O-acyltransferase [Halothermothrix orenii H 168]
MNKLRQVLGKVLYWLAYSIFNIYFLVVHRWQVVGKENRLTKGPLIVMSNHVSNLDPPVVGCIMNRQVHFMAKKELFENPVSRWVFNTIGTFPVKRGKPDRKALRQAFSILKQEKVLGVFPEGTRHRQGKPGKARLGAVMIALRSEAPILPVGIRYDDGKKIRVSIGEPFTLDEYYGRKVTREEMKEAGQIIMDRIIQQLNNIEPGYGK